ncbi:N-acetylglucosaminyl-diphospho-decaprenol L-rhamnosyltransferase [Neomoorella glycerini]|uniref:N-acetylglucosaminyl-diphospho-decaprenol L-rhamnosyltransferase n=1 Tax=Neomoorella glycerini TaxID=55779 RepID=A0A6I5ZRR0_9FIRM|nr:glycosyltransferase family 2 protein [Moorella glycerini]QGP92682.1 N-acetylglucosaminyl-diphospho-decaprenol L-rhamnosyltransferase [Moorella glycerini]
MDYNLNTTTDLDGISIIIVNYNTKHLLKDIITSIYDSCIYIKHEIIIVDNASSDGSNQLIKQSFPGIKLIENQVNMGYAAAVNIGVLNAQYEAILVANSDIKFRLNTIDKMFEYLKANPCAGIIGAQLTNPDGTWQRSYSFFPTCFNALRELFYIINILLRIEKVMWTLGLRRPRRVDYLDGACFMMRKHQFLDIGGFDEIFFFYAEDADLCLRLKKEGYERILLRDAIAVHYRGASSSICKPEHYSGMQAKSNCKFVEKHFGIRKAQLYALLKSTHFFITYSMISALNMFIPLSKKKDIYRTLWQSYASKIFGHRHIGA